jgi:chemotaxis protein MotA
MDPATLVGGLMILVGVFIGSLLKGVSPAAYFSVPAAFLIVFVAAFGAAFLGGTKEDMSGFMKVFLQGIKGRKAEDPNVAIDQIVDLAEKARREGLLALEEEVAKVEDPFLKRGLQLAIDGADPDVVEEIMETEVRAMTERHKANAKLMLNIGIFAPTFGIIGAVVGLIATLKKLDNPDELGKGIAAAFVATFWGVFLANGIFLPWANKLGRMSAEEAAHKRLVIEGVLNIQSGANPRMLGDLMRSSLPPSKRPAEGSEERKSA